MKIQRRFHSSRDMRRASQCVSRNGSLPNVHGCRATATHRRSSVSKYRRTTNFSMRKLTGSQPDDAVIKLSCSCMGEIGSPTPKEQPPRKLSGKRTMRDFKIWKEIPWRSWNPPKGSCSQAKRQMGRQVVRPFEHPLKQKGASMKPAEH